jgi:hypothetical protein
MITHTLLLLSLSQAQSLCNCPIKLLPSCWDEMITHSLFLLPLSQAHSLCNCLFKQLPTTPCATFPLNYVLPSCWNEMITHSLLLLSLSQAHLAAAGKLCKLNNISKCIPFKMKCILTKNYIRTNTKDQSCCKAYVLRYLLSFCATVFSKRKLDKLFSWCRYR